MIKPILKGLKYAIQGNRFILTLQYIIHTLYNLAPLLFSVIWAYLIDTAINGIQNDSIAFNSMVIPFILYATVETLKAVFFRLKNYLHNRVYDKLEVKVNTDVLIKYSSLDIQSLEDPEVNRLFQIVKESYNWQISSLVFIFTKLLSALILILISTVILYKISPLVFIIVLVSSLPSLFTNMKFGSIGWGIWRADADKHRKFSLVSDFLLNKENLIEAKVNNVTPHLINIIRAILEDYHKKRKPMLRNRALYTLLADIVSVTGSLFSVYILINSALSGNISIGNLILGASIFLSFSSYLATFLYELTEIYNSGLFMKDFLKFMNLKSKVKSGKIKLEKFKTPPKIEFKNVSFKYPNTDRMILKDINLTIEPGMKVALVGENGVGKTTLIKILARFYHLTKGSIYINNKNLIDLETESWEQNLGLLTQHFNTYPAFNLEENIHFGDVSKKFNSSEIKEAAEKSKVSDFVDKYPSKFKQLLSIQFDGGVDPSWGQWQRIGIARTLYRDPSIIILDEPTSAIDAQAEYEIFQNINKQTEGKTVIYVSHRYSTVRNADIIFVLKDGEIVESGNHKKLIELNGEYAKNFKLQADGYK